MTQDTRSTRVTIYLILSMTLGAALLMWLEVPTRGWAAGTYLMAERGGSIEAVTLTFVPEDQPVLRGEYDCVVRPEGAPIWDPRGDDVRHVRVAILASPEDRLTDSQAGDLMRILGSMKQQRGLDLSRVKLHPDSDDRYRPELPRQAYELRDLLVRKGIL